MNWLDIIILTVAGVAAFIGARAGLVRALSSVVGMALAILLASNFFREASAVFDVLLNSENASNILGFLLIFVVVLVISAIIGSNLRRVVNFMMLGWIDRGGGLVLGVILAFALISPVLSMVDSFPILGLDVIIVQSFFGSFLVDDFDVVLNSLKLLPDDLGQQFP